MNLMVSLLAAHYTSWCLMALAQSKHYQYHFAHEGRVSRRRWLRAAGSLLALLTLLYALWRGDWALGAVSWAMSWMVSAMAWVLLQPYRPALARRLALPLLVLAAVLQL
ncbi:MAG: DUF3325 family protein [Dyella sp.]